MKALVFALLLISNFCWSQAGYIELNGLGMHQPFSEVPKQVGYNPISFWYDGFIYFGNGYIPSTHLGNNYYNEFFRFNLSNNLWEKLHDTPFYGKPSSAFADSSMFFFCTSGSTGVISNMTWRYDTWNDNWTRVADYPGFPDEELFAFRLDSSIFVGGGHLLNSNEFYEYHINSNTWTNNGYLPIGGRAKGISDNLNGYLFNVVDSNNVHRSFKFDNQSNLWTPIADFPSQRDPYASIAYFLNNIAFVYYSDSVFEYNPVLDTWTGQTSPFYIPNSVSDSDFYLISNYFVAKTNPFNNTTATLIDYRRANKSYNWGSIDGKFYYRGSRYEVSTNTWTEDTLSMDFLFQDNHKGYGKYNQSFCVYNPDSATILPLSPFPTSTLIAFSFKINNKFYFVPRGTDSLWCYDIQSDHWLLKNSFPGTIRESGMTFAVQGFGFLLYGTSSLSQSHIYDFWKYDPLMDTWTQKNNLPVNSPGDIPNGFAISTSTHGYMGLGGSSYPGVGSGSGLLSRIFIYNPIADLWGNFQFQEATGCEYFYEYHNAIYFGGGNTCTIQPCWSAYQDLYYLLQYGVPNTTSVDEVEMNQLVFPTVFESTKPIELHFKNHSKSQVEVFSIDGKLVFHNQYCSDFINLGNLAKGMYICKIIANGKSGIQKIIVE